MSMTTGVAMDRYIPRLQAKASVGLSTQYLQPSRDPFEKVVEEIKTHRNSNRTPDYWEIVDVGKQSLRKKEVDILASLSSEGYRFTVHAPYEENLNIAELDRERRRQTLMRLRASLDAAANIEARVWIFHPGHRRVEDANLGQIQRINQESITTLYDWAKASGIDSAVENMPPDKEQLMVIPSDFEDFFEVTGLRLPIAFDIGHAHLAGICDEFIVRLFKYFQVIHVHDNMGASDDHLNLGEGVVKWKDLVLLLKNKGFYGLYTVEAKRRPYESILSLRELLI
jgi:sugar phosphate isomerase/epimerase